MGKSWEEFRKECLQIQETRECFKEEIEEWIHEYKLKIVIFEPPDLYSKGKMKVLEDLEKMIAEM